MPAPDLPSPPPSANARFGRMMVRMALVSLLAAVVAVAIVAAGDSGFHIHMLIATGLGVFLTILLGTGLMSLVFLSNSSGHDASAARPSNQVSEEEELK